MSDKELQFLQEMLPGVKHMAVLWHASNSGAVRRSEAGDTGALAVGLPVNSRDVRSLEEIDAALQAAASAGVCGIPFVHGPFMTGRRTPIAQLALQHSLPAVSATILLARAGGLMSYGPDILRLFRRAAVYVDKIFKGTKPAELPVEQPIEFRPVINFKTA